MAGVIDRAAAVFVAAAVGGNSSLVESRRKEEVMSAMKLTGLKCGTWLVLAFIALSFGLVQAQQQSGAKQEKVAALKKSLAENQAALKKYSWTETTEVSLKGEVKKRMQKECHYGPDGKVVKTPIQGGEQAQQQGQAGGGRHGGLRGAIVEHKVDEMKDYMQRVVALVHEYVPPDGQRIQQAAAAGNVSLQPSQGVATLVFKDYLKPGDSVALGFNSETKKISDYKVQSYLDNPKDDALSLNVAFASLPDGTNYPQQSVLNVPNKKMVVTVTNSNYVKTGQ
jgi:hypothetical protein